MGVLRVLVLGVLLFNFALCGADSSCLMQATWKQWRADNTIIRESEEVTSALEAARDASKHAVRGNVSLKNATDYGNNARFDAALLALAPQPGRHAYAVAATTRSYALAACTVAKILRDLGKAPEIEIVGVYGGDVIAGDTLRKCGQFDHVVLTNLKSKRSAGGYYHDIAVKFAAFGAASFTQYSRVILFDADVHPLRNMDFLFDVPAEFQLFGPRAYWLGPPDMVTGGIYGIVPSTSLHESLMQLWDSPAPTGGYPWDPHPSGGYPPGEMDVVNDFFRQANHRSAFGLLPANFMVLDSHWHREEEKEPPQPDPHPGSNSLSDIFSIHFTGYQKPWYHSMADDLSHFTPEYRNVRQAWWDAYNVINAKV